MCIEYCPQMGCEHECHNCRRKHAGPLVGLLIKKAFYGVLTGHKHPAEPGKLKQKTEGKSEKGCNGLTS